MTKKYSYFKSELTDLFVISDGLHKETFSGMDDEYNCSRIVRKLNTLTDENEQLKQRNDRQAKQLDRLYSLIEEKDWTALSDIIDDFKRCEEQLQKEWGVYDESE